MLAYGALYLRIVGPFYGFFGAGLALYFASQGAGRLGWPMTAAILRVLIAAGGGWLAVAKLGNSTGLFAALAAALVTYGLPTSRRSPAARGSRSAAAAEAPRAATA